jgi:hypothetical protein
VKLLFSIGLGVTAALIGLDLQKAPVWGLPRALGQKHEDGVRGTAALLTGLRKRAWCRKPRDIPWDEICSDLAFQVRAGNTLVQAIRSVSQDGTSSAHKKLAKAYKFYETGVPITKAMEMVADGDGELSMIAAILEIGSISGGDTGSLLWRAFEILRRRRVFRGEVDARLSEARITSWLLLALPWLIGLFMLQHDPNLIRTFAASQEGRLLIIAGVVLWGLGGALIRMSLRSVFPVSAHTRYQMKAERGRKAS